MQQNTLETVVGFAVIFIASIFIAFAYKQNNQMTLEAAVYNLQANFQNIEGITLGSDVMIAGIKVGTVKSITLDQNDFVAKIILQINQHVKIPKDSQAAIVTSGLLGNKYIMIAPGADSDIFIDNDRIKYTQSAVNIESLIGKIIYSIGSK